jgi:hypothetical protein
VAVWSALALALLGLGIADAVAGIAISTYLWVIASIVIVGLVVGAPIGAGRQFLSAEALGASSIDQGGPGLG